MNAWSKIIGGDAAETGSGPGSYDIRKSVWHVNKANPEINGGGGWGIFNSIFGWTNSATYGSVIAYNLYWLCIIIAFGSLGFYEKRGHWPFMKARARAADAEEVESDGTSQEGVVEVKDGVQVTASSGRQLSA
jgi:high-affinity iron transporter